MNIKVDKFSTVTDSCWYTKNPDCSVTAELGNTIHQI